MKRVASVIRLQLFVVLCTALAALALVVTSSAATAQERRELNLSLGDTQVIDVDFDIGDVIVGAEAIANAVPLSNRSITLQTRAAGSTQIILREKDGTRATMLSVLVTENFGQLEAVFDELFSGNAVSVRNVNGRVLVSGTVPDEAQRTRMIEIASAYSSGEVVDALKVSQPRQIMLKVNILELSRSGGKDLNINLFRDPPSADSPNGAPFGIIQGNTTISGQSIDYLIQALESKGLARRLANPTLVSVNGATASFVVGGEVPITVFSTDAETGASTGVATAEFREFGVKLDFTPQILEDNRLRLEISPEVSEVDWNRRVDSNPAFLTRKVTTTVELQSGNSFAIAGLLQSDSVRSVRQFPGLGNIPILGALFRSASYQNNQTELVVVVTPYLVNKHSPQAIKGDPTAQSGQTNEADLFLLGTVEASDDMIQRFRMGFGVDGPFGHILPQR
ncbi:type II and III secretion system protein family protein [Lutimaribacter sp. EGI FJ00015]|uniref:Type II and III secretion system protein family protein n=1 Tax=Lutimaribacter degradans TaxID=2945989 RepID=A0ACC5ZYB2_9RHOB|nr:type II and III secretion system protein family protein [Lutimaribacter sp. EGI FJ00013]MCM2563363.1 type II and III secretion system protein family protein [Lutimaribacter sp. EGI FJ00013]MCO0614559.1 type II and III secretion system protein family protein [Lutimaribacter sp. EGI FJ00015]MCO0637231.1 type II and III secretion system protein family protein [Lutimaribacter sp. EGI FJ00014]